MRDEEMSISRRALLSTAAAATAASVLPGRALAAGKPDSNFDGVQIGTITYSFRSLPGSGEETLKHILASGISTIELMGNVPERFAKDWAKKNGKEDPMGGFKALRKMYNEAKRSPMWQSSVMT